MSADSSDSSRQSDSLDRLDDADRNHVRNKVLSLRSKRRAEINLSTRLIANDTLGSDRLTWVGVDDDLEHLSSSAFSSCSLSSPSKPSNSSEYRNSGDDDDDDADSTILGHYIQALPVPPNSRPSLTPKQMHPRSSFASEETYISSHESSSQMSCMADDDDVDSHSLHTTSATDSSSPAPSRRASSARTSIASHRISEQVSCKDLAVTALPVQASSQPLGPPPDMPLPPKPLCSPRIRSPSAKWRECRPSRTPSRASALTAASFRSSISVRSNAKSTESSLASPRLIPTSSQRNDQSDGSDDEISGIRNICQQFPSPFSSKEVRSPATSRLLDQSDSRLGDQAVPASVFSATPSQWHNPTLKACQPSNSMAKSTMNSYPDSETPHVHDDRSSSTKGQGGSEGVFSEILCLTDSTDTLANSQRMYRLPYGSNVSVAKVGLGAYTLSRYDSQHSQLSASKTKQTAPHAKLSQPMTTRGVQNERKQMAKTKTRETRIHHQRSDTLSRSMSELMVALDLEANEWGQRLSKSENTGSCNEQQTEIAQAQASQAIPAMRHAALSHSDSSQSSEQLDLVASDSLPSLSSSGSQAISLDDSHGPATAESSLTRPNTATSSASYDGEADATDESRTSTDLRSIYEAYRLSSSTMASHLTAPVVRIEDPEGDQVADSELDGNSSSDDMPRKRNKSSRKKSLGFEDQRAALRSRPFSPHRSASLSSKPSQAFRSTLLPTQEEMAASHDDPPSAAANTDADPYAFYEFSPSLPPFMPAGVSPRDLTGRGTWSSIVARASETMRRQPSITSIDSFATAGSGPVSLREIRAVVQAKQKHADAAHRAREQMSDQFATMSYRPFAIHQHAASFANQAVAWEGQRSSVSSIAGASSLCEGMTSGRSSSMSCPGYAESMAPSVADYGTRWPVAVGADQGVGPDDVSSILSTKSFWLSRRPSASQPPAKVYVEFCMQTSPQPSPTESLYPPLDSLTVDDGVSRADAQVGSDVREDHVVQHDRELDNLATDAPLQRRKSIASHVSMHNLDFKLDQPGLWPSRIRAPRLSSTPRRGSEARHKGTTSHGGEVDSDEESELDVHAELEDLAERSGVLDASRGFKRKLHTSAASVDKTSTDNDSNQRPIASIPARSRRISAALSRIRSQRASRSAGWTSSDDELDEANTAAPKTPHRIAASGRPSLPGSVPAKDRCSTVPLRRSKSMASMRAMKRHDSSRNMLRARSPSPDLSALTHPSDDEEVLLTADFDMDATGHFCATILDEEFDMMVGQTITTRFSGSGKANSQPKTQNGISEAADTQGTRATAKKSSYPVDDDVLSGTEDSKDSQQTVQMHARSRTSSMSSVIEMIQEADELLSSNGHSIGHSSSHDTNVSDSGGTSGHDPQRPNQVVAEILRSRMSMRSRGLPTPITLATARSVHSASIATNTEKPAAEETKVGADLEDEAPSPDLQDTPDTMAGSEIWSAFHADRSSTASTATTWSNRSIDLAQPATRTSLPTVDVVKEEESGSHSRIATDDTRLTEKQGAADASASKMSPHLRRKSSCLPVARPTNQKQSRPSLPLAPKSSSLAASVASTKTMNKAAVPSTAAMRRYQSVSGLQARAADVERSTVESQRLVASQGASATAHPSGGCLRTPSKPIRGVVREGVTPSKLPSLRSAASTSSLRSRAAVQKEPSPRTLTSRLRTPNAPGRSQLPCLVAVRASGLSRPASASTN